MKINKLFYSIALVRNLLVFLIPAGCLPGEKLQYLALENIF